MITKTKFILILIGAIIIGTITVVSIMNKPGAKSSAWDNIPDASEQISNIKKPEPGYTNVLNTLYTATIDSCEYILFPTGDGITHKGNCKFCRERLIKLISNE